MQFEQTAIPGAYVIDITPFTDDRGIFARTFCAEEFAAHGLATTMVQSNTCFSPAKGTLRGMHFQKPPHAEDKLIRCTAGAVYDVIIDIRPDSPAFRQWVAYELSQHNRRMVYVPQGCAHGYITLTDNVEICYLMSHQYDRDSASGLRYDDPAFRISWPMNPLVIAESDTSWPPFSAA